MEYYTSDLAGSGQFWVCINCNKLPTPEGHDGCLGILPLPVMNACCGHGNDDIAYIQYFDEEGNGGVCIRGEEAVVEQERLIKERGEVL